MVVKKPEKTDFCLEKKVDFYRKGLVPPYNQSPWHRLPRFQRLWFKVWSLSFSEQFNFLRGE